MKRPTKEQIEEIIKELPHPRDNIGDFYEVAWQSPEDRIPINASAANKCAESYTTTLLFKRVVDANGYDMSWQLDEGFKSFDEFVAPVDEYGIAPILTEYNAMQALPRISAKFDTFCRAYMQTRKSAREAAYVEMNCALMSAVIDSNGDGDALKVRINELIKAYNEYTESEANTNKTK